MTETQQFTDALKAVRFEADPAGPRTSMHMLMSMCSLLEEILLELRRGNSIERTGAVSSVQIEDRPTKDLPVRVTSKTYTGSALPVDEALADHARLHVEAERRALEGWTSTLSQVEAERSGGAS